MYLGFTAWSWFGPDDWGFFTGTFGVFLLFVFVRRFHDGVFSVFR